MSASNSLPIACSLTAEERVTRAVDFGGTLAAAEESVEIEQGFAFRFAGDDAGLLSRITDLIAHERECCLFFNFSLTLEHNLGPIWLSIMGPEGVKKFLRPVLETGSS